MFDLCISNIFLEIVTFQIRNQCKLLTKMRISKKIWKQSRSCLYILTIIDNSNSTRKKAKMGQSVEIDLFYKEINLKKIFYRPNHEAKWYVRKILPTCMFVFDLYSML